MSMEKTPVLGLPQWQWNEHPSFILDINPAFMAIDENAGKANNSITELEQWKSDTSPVVTKNTNDIAALQTNVSDAQVDILNLKTRVSTAETDISADKSNITALQNRVKTLEDDNAVQNGALTGFDAANTVQGEFDKINSNTGWTTGSVNLLIGGTSGTVVASIGCGYNDTLKALFIGGFADPTNVENLFGNNVILEPGTMAKAMYDRWIQYSSVPGFFVGDTIQPIYATINGVTQGDVVGFSAIGPLNLEQTLAITFYKAASVSGSYNHYNFEKFYLKRF